MNQIFDLFDELTESASADSDVKRSNANVGGDTSMGTMLQYGSEAAKRYNLERKMEPRFAKAHIDGDIHIHDLDFYALTETCCQIDLTRLFHDGFNTGHGWLREPQRIESYAALACIAIQSNQNDQHGGQSIPAFDYDMAPGVAKSFWKNLQEEMGYVLYACEFSDDLKQHPITNKKKLHGCLCEDLDVSDSIASYKVAKAIRKTRDQTYQAMESLIHNLNSMHSRAGAQVPFSSLNYGTDTSEEGRMVMDAILTATESGLGHGETPIFPIQIFRVKDGINYNPGDPNYDLFQKAIHCSAKRLFPNFSFIDAPYNLKYYKPGHPETEVAYMGCRTRVLGNVYDPDREQSFSRGNLSFTSINLPRLAIRAKLAAEEPISLFMDLLYGELQLVRDQLLARLEIQSKRKVRSYPFLMGQGIWLDSEKLGPDDEVREVLKHGTLSIGFIGLAEALKMLLGKHHGESEEAQQLGLSIIRYLRLFTDNVSKQYGLNFTLLATPAEGLAGRFVKLDRKRYGIIPGVTDREYYTNSFHIPVYYPINAFRKLDLEAPYHELTNAGHISYVEMDGDPLNNLKAFTAIIRHMHDIGIGYGSINHPVDRCDGCGHTGVIGDTCPNCGGKDGQDVHISRIRRITGYLVGTLDRWNDAKQAEERDRVKHV